MIPLNIDGLIPVNRRLLLTMHRIAKKTTKSARIVGELIGTLHAHGDCLRGSTLVPLLNGNLTPISELCGKDPQWILSYDETTQEYIPTKAHSWRVGQVTNELYKIHLSNGGILECTSNHPFLLKNQNWRRADELKIGDILFGGSIYINREYKILKTHNKYAKLHRYVYEYFTDKQLISNNIIHHKDENKINNIPENLELTGRPDHAKRHITQKKLDCLERGRKTMFLENSPIREKIYNKNKELRRLICKTAALRKAIKVIKYLIKNNLELTEENYYSIGKNIVYNLTKLKTIEQKYNLTFNELIKIAPTWKADTSSATGLTKIKLDNVKKTYKYKINRPNSELIFKVFNTLNNFNPTWNEYITTAKKLSNYANIVYSNKDKLCEKLNIETPADILKNISADCGIYIINIEKVILDKPEEFYDFTVDNYHNMIIATTDDPSNINFVVAHNSSAYGSLVNLVHEGFADDSKSTWGGPGLIDAPSPAQRYTETSIMPWIDKLAFEYVNYVPWESLELDEEPLYLPCIIPVGLIGNTVHVGLAYHKTVIPKYSKKDLFKRLHWLILNRKKYKIPDFNTNENINEETCGPCIKPFKDDCDVEEYENRDFYKILMLGEGKIEFKPKIKLIKNKTTQLQILGRSPLATFQSLLNDYNKNILPFTDKPIDQSKKSIKIIINLKRNIDVDDFIDTFREKYLNKVINFKCYFCDLTGQVKQYSIDQILINCFTRWRMASIKKLMNDVEIINNKLINNKICYQIKKLLENNHNITSINDVVKELNNLTQDVNIYDIKNKSWIKNNIVITDKMIYDCCINNNIQKLIEYKSIEEKLFEEFKKIKYNIDNHDSFIMNIITDNLN